MKKLYYATKGMDVVFASAANGEALQKEAEKFLKEEEESNHFFKTEIKEVKSIEDVSENWRVTGTLIWGVDGELSVEEALISLDPEYDQYLKLKRKFENS